MSMRRYATRIHWTERETELEGPELRNRWEKLKLVGEKEKLEGKRVGRERGTHQWYNSWEKREKSSRRPDPILLRQSVARLLPARSPPPPPVV
ncbi:hypothetical protein BRADI_2g34375v3 [Brachypodium distachyon]|uniref:Uncharacterized protein n=1 Tax=Brachypodium distachyon TaxID=15368 RepID=A0A0Q3K8T1_BRADI|nr:hypothetical protein BRADI_2g34375v3 [Brachypodium distachyon]